MLPLALILVAAAGTFDPPPSDQLAPLTPRAPTPPIPLSAPGARRLDVKDFRPVEPVTSDVSVLGISPRVMPADLSLRLPNDFRGVYQIPKNASSKYAGWYARVQGGLIVAFPQSWYAVDELGQIHIEVPPGSVYFVGGIPQDNRRAAAPQPSDAQQDGRDDRSVSTLVDQTIPETQPRAKRSAPVPSPLPTGAEPVSDTPAAPPEPGALTAAQIDRAHQTAMTSLMSDEPFAAERVAQRLRQALVGRAPAPLPAPAPAPAVAPTPRPEDAGWRKAPAAPAPSPNAAPSTPAKPAPRESE